MRRVLNWFKRGFRLYFDFYSLPTRSILLNDSVKTAATKELSDRYCL